jgi:hypothetical protein
MASPLYPWHIYGMKGVRSTYLSLALLAVWSCGVTDENPDPDPDPNPVPQQDSVLTLVPADTTLRPNQSVRLTPSLVESDSGPVASFDVDYRSLDPAIATVDPAGVVTGVGTGQTSIIGSVGRAEDTITVSVPMSFAKISAGFSSCGIRTDGQARCWGLNHQGELGSGLIGLPEPGPVTPVGDLSLTLIRTSEASDSTFTCGLTEDGSAWCWGANAAGQLGRGDVFPDPSPRKVVGGLVFVDLDVGGAHACALAAGSGEAFCWGDNDYGQLGTGDSTISPEPVAVATSLRFAAITTGTTHTCGLLATGEVYCWGYNSQGQLGTGTTEGSPTPALVSGPVRFTALDAGSLDTCGIADNGDAYCWGYNIFGEVGTGQFVFEPVLTPSLVVGGHKWTGLSVGSGFACGLTVEGPAYCWGIDADGRLGIGVTSANPHPTPELVLGDEQFTAISAGFDQTCAVSAALDKPVFCWGRNDRGQLDGYPGDFLVAVSFVPRLVSGF